jgi:hypothetical protein
MLCVQLVQARERVMPTGITHIFIFLVHLGIIVMVVLGLYSGLSGRVRTVYLFSLYVVPLLSSSLLLVH